MTGHGGWPMTVFLTPDGEPFYGGTYFPPEPTPRDARLPAGADGGLRRVSRAREDVSRQATAIVDAVRQIGRARPSTDPLTDEQLGGDAGLERQFDESGAASAARRSSRQPRRSSSSCACSFAGRGRARDGHADARRDGRGGIYDHVGGGFHRYSVDARWLVPHFEKMLYDNALLAPRISTAGW